MAAQEAGKCPAAGAVNNNSGHKIITRLFEWGAPLHALILDKNIRRPDNRAPGRTRERSLYHIDGKTHLLTPEILIIADSGKPVAAAGIMGGEASEVSSGTVNVLLEGAIFDPVLVRKGCRLMAAQTEASYRFERGVDAERVKLSVERAVMLIVSLCGGKAQAFIRKGSGAAGRKQIEFSVTGAEKLLNIKLATGKAYRILSGLGFKVKKVSSSTLKVEVPLFKRYRGRGRSRAYTIHRIVPQSSWPSVRVVPGSALPD